MKRRDDSTHGFTLIELLVVIAIIGLLMAVLMPALRMAKEMGRQILCSAHLRTLGSANELYANEYNGAFVPLKDASRKTAPVAERQTWWIQNQAFRKLWAVDDYKSTTTGLEGSQFFFPEKYLCPSDRISKDPANAASTVLGSYGYNVTDYGWNAINSENYAGYKVKDIQISSERLAFADTIDWWISWDAADYSRGWDILGQANIAAYKDSPYNLHGPTIYRHREGADLVFYDGHVEYMKKEDVFIKEDYDASPKRPGMWSTVLLTYKKYHP